MEKLVLEKDKEDLYILEVNDKGDTIEFDLTDIGLAERILKASDKIIEIDKKYKEQLETIDCNKEEDIKKLIELEVEKSKKMRELFDSFLGDGACQKIFGDKNNYGQFLSLMEALEPHFAKMKIKIDKAKRKLADKYIIKNKEVI